MELFLNYKKKQIQRFTEAVRQNKKKIIKGICDKNCKFIGFTDKKGTLDSFLAYTTNKENTITNEKIWYDGQNLFKTSITEYKVMEILGIQADQKLTLKYTFRLGKIKTVEVTQWQPKMTSEGLQKWETYMDYYKETIDVKMKNILNNAIVAVRYKEKNQ